MNLLRIFGLPDNGESTVVWPMHLPTFDSVTGCVVYAAAAVAGVTLAVLAYRAEPDYLRPRRRRQLLVLRLAALAVVAWIATGATLTLARREENPGTLVILVDRSQSMTIADKRTTAAEQAQVAALLDTQDPSAIAAATRAAIAQAAINRSPVLARLASRHTVAVFGFGADAAALPIPLGGTAEQPRLEIGACDGNATQLGAALLDVSARLKGQQIAGVLVVSDGVSNRGPDPLQITPELRMPVHALGVGVPDARDIEIPFLLMEDVVFKGDTFPLQVRVRQRGYAGRTVQLVVRQDDQVVLTRPVKLGEERETTVAVDVMAKRSGTFDFSATIEPQADEITAANNRRVKTGVRVIDTRLRVLLADDGPRWDFRYLKGALEADPKRIDPRFVVRQVDEDLANANRNRYLPRLPATREAIAPYHLLILGDLPTSLLGRPELEQIERWVREDAGSLLVVAGPWSMPGAYAGSKLADLLPVEFEAMPGITREEELSRTVARGYRPRLTLDGQRHPLFRIVPDQAENARLWGQSSPLYAFTRCLKAKPGATVLMEHPAETASGAPMPLVAQHRYGRGQVLYLAIHDAWRWRSRPGGIAHRRLVSQAINTLGMARLLGGSGRVQIESGQSEYAVGDEVQVIARLRTRDYQPSTATEVPATLERGADRRPAILRPEPGQPGVFSARLRLPAEGAWRLTIDGEEEGELRLQAVPPRLEFDDPTLHEQELRRLCAATGGTYAPLHEADRLAEAICARPAAVEIRREELPIWNLPLLMILAVSLFGLELLLRKRSDLL